MTVSELMKELAQHPNDMPVFIEYDGMVRRLATCEVHGPGLLLFWGSHAGHFDYEDDILQELRQELREGVK